MKKYEERIAVIGLGYVGFPLAVEFSKQYRVTGYDLDHEKIDRLRKGIDMADGTKPQSLHNAALYFTAEPAGLESCNVFIVTVPTPIHADRTPNLNPLIAASKTIGQNLKEGDLVVYESTVYPGATEEVCVPVLEQHSGLQLGKDFKLGYSPERINPGDRERHLTNIVKVVSGSDEEALNRVDQLYSTIIEAGTCRVSSIKAAEAAKVIENAQRDVNIAFMNELSIVFNQMGLDTMEVIDAASTKWNFMRFEPGLVGGHCIGVDPYYFIYKAKMLGCEPRLVAAAREVNQSVSAYIVQNIVKELVKRGSTFQKIGILGMTYKANCSDIRNSRVLDIVEELMEYGIDVLVYDSEADAEEVYQTYGIRLALKEELAELDSIVVAVPHDKFRLEFPPAALKQMLKPDRQYIFDLKSFYASDELEENELEAWNL